MLDDSLYGNRRDEVEHIQNHILIWSYYGLDTNGTKKAWIEGTFQDAIPRGKPILFGPDINPSDTAFTSLAKDSIRYAQPYWSSVSALYADELNFDAAGMDAYINQVNAYIAGLGLAPKPWYMNFTDKQIMTGDGWKAKGISFIGIEAYIDPLFQDDTDVTKLLGTKCQDQWNRVAGEGKPIFFIIQGYNRNGAWTNLTSLEDIQAVSFLKFKTNPQCLGWWIFSYERPGGTRAVKDSNGMLVLKLEHEWIARQL